MALDDDAKGPSMLRRDRLLLTLISLGLCGQAAAGTVYKCSGGPDEAVSYSSRPVPGMSCKPIGYKGQPSRRNSPVAFGYGPGAASGGMTGASAPPLAAADTALAGSVAIPAAPGAPAISQVASAPARTQ